MLPAFHFYLRDPIQQGRACIGKYDGRHPSITCATSGGKIFIHSPHQSNTIASGSSFDGIQYLNINSPITALAAGLSSPGAEQEVLLVGTETNLLVYNVEKNTDVFYRDVAEGVSSLTYGRLGNQPSALALVGGNCSIQGFSSTGSEDFWTVSGDVVTSMLLWDVNGDGNNELIVGSADYDIRIFEGEEVVCEVTEADQVIGLTGMHRSRFGYALANGTIGIYDWGHRAWRVKSKHEVASITAFDMDGDGVPELISGWSNGKVEVRRDDTGEVVFRDTLAAPVASLLTADYRMDGNTELIACSVEGEVRGYLPLSQDPNDRMAASTVQEENNLAELTQRKQELLYELQAYENRSLAKGTFSAVVGAAGKDGGGGTVGEAVSSSSSAAASSSVVPSGTRVACALKLNPDFQRLEIVVSTSVPDAMIKAVIILGENAFEGSESHLACPAVPSASLSIPVSCPKNVATLLQIKALVGFRSSPSFHVFEMEQCLPKFAMFLPTPSENESVPESWVMFALPERLMRVLAWIRESFGPAAEPRSGAEGFLAHFVSLRNGRPLSIAYRTAEGGKMIIRTDDMETAGDVVQDLCSFLAITDLESTADFPQELEIFESVVERVREHNELRQKMMAETADCSNIVKSLVVRAEDARLLRDMTLMKKMYMELYHINRELIVEHMKRSSNHTQLLQALKEVNRMVQLAAKLRVGNPKTLVVAKCREAIKSNNVSLLCKIIQKGGKIA